ncbi:MAG: YlmC/YmxH family sporulation protein [Bacillota bacterium]
MRASELIGKEVIDVNTGARLGAIQKNELLVNTSTGMVEALILIKHGWAGREITIKTIPWRLIRKISEELVIFAGEEEGES